MAHHSAKRDLRHMTTRQMAYRLVAPTGAVKEQVLGHGLHRGVVVLLSVAYPLWQHSLAPTKA